MSMSTLTNRRFLSKHINQNSMALSTKRIIQKIIFQSNTRIVSPLTTLSSRKFRLGSRHYYTTISPSISAQNTTNPIRKIVDNLTAKPNPDLEVIPLSIGDPTIFGNFTPPIGLADEIHKNCKSLKVNGYGHSCGLQIARESVAKRVSFGLNGNGQSKFPIQADDVIMTNGCSHALDLAIQVLANPGQNILLPQPAFPLYETLCSSRGINVKHYRLDPDSQWDIDLYDLEQQIDSNTACILINSPSNPCGNVFSVQHLENICKVAEKHKLPILADEIYADMVFPNSGIQFAMLNDVSLNVPFLSVGGLAKQYMIPGWRLGWITIHDRNNVLSEIKSGLINLSTLLVGPSTLQQSCVPFLLEETPKNYYEDVLKQLSDNAAVVTDVFKDCSDKLRVITPQGAMYVLVEILDDRYFDDTILANKLIKEKSVIVLPGQCFGVKKVFRIVISPPKAKLKEACERIKDFFLNR